MTRPTTATRIILREIAYACVMLAVAAVVLGLAGWTGWVLLGAPEWHP